MKRIIKIFFIAIIVITASSCSSTKEICITGKPGVEIYSQYMEKIAEIESDGKASASVSFNPETYRVVHHIMFSHEKDSDLYIPFALNFEEHKFGNNKLVTAFAYTSPLLFFSPFTWMGISQDEQSDLNFQYLPEQATNQDIVFTPLKQTAEYKTLDKSSQNISKSKANTERRRFSSGSSHNNNDPMSVITGRYSGKGELLDGSDVIEEYTDLSIVIKKKSENTVSVEVLASDGYSYFDEEMIYSVTKQDEQFVLKQKGANSRIVIKNGNLSYTNHNINDGETVFTLKITADK